MKKQAKPKQKKIEQVTLFKDEDVIAMQKQFEATQASWKAHTTTTTTTTTTEQDRVNGSLLGLAYGDVLGCPTEGMKWYGKNF